MQRGPNPQPTISTLRILASTANTMYKGADRPNMMKRLFARSLVLGDTNELENVFDGGMETFVTAPHRESVLDRDSFADYFRSSNGKQLWFDKLSYIVTHSDGTRERRTKFRVWHDYGNAVYQAYCIFSTDTISYFGKELPKWGTFANTDQCWKPRS